MPKFFVCSDIHSYFHIFKDALDKAGYDVNNPDHYIICCGDYFDQGPEPLATMDFFANSPRTILIRGNHEDLLKECINREDFGMHDIQNGTVATILAFGQRLPKDIEEFQKACRVADVKLQPFLSKMINYFETENYVFVHGWIPSLDDGLPPWYAKKRRYIYNSDWRECHEKDWRRARWTNGMDAWSQGNIEPNKTIVCGHWHTSWGHHYLHNWGDEWGDNSHFTPFEDKGIIAIDACTAYSNKVNILVIEDNFLKEAN